MAQASSNSDTAETAKTGQRRRFSVRPLRGAGLSEYIRRPSDRWSGQRSSKETTTDPAGQTAQAGALLTAWLHRLQYYVLALLFVAGAALVRGEMGDVLNPTPFLVFYLAWVGAAAFGGLGPGLLATVASWLCVDLFFAPTPWQFGFSDTASVSRFVIFMAGGLAVSAVGEKMRRARMHEHRRTEELTVANAALRASEEKYRLLVENSKDVTWIVDLQGKWTFISSNVEKVIGYRADELIGKILWDFLAPECHDLVKDKLRRRLRGEDLAPYEVLFRGKDGRHTPFEVLTASVVDDGGNIVGVQGVSRDITERKRAQEALAESRKRYRGLVEKINDWVWEIDADGVYTYSSPRALELLGYPPEEIVGKTPFDLMPPAEAQRVWNAFRPIWLERKPLELLENTLVRKDGSLVTVETSGMPVFAEDGAFLGYTGIDRDVTARKRAEEALRELNSTLESKVAQRTAELEHRAWQLQKLTLELTEAEERERERLAAILHDDLQQLLVAAKFHLGLVGSGARNPGESQEIIGEVKQMLKEAIDKSRSLSHELGPAALRKGDLVEALDWLAEQMQVKYGLTVRVETYGEVKTPSNAVKAFVYRASQELLFNVVKHARVKKAHIRIRRLSRYICLSVSDRGQGFDPQKITKTAGFGLLNIRERAALLDGRMKIKGAEGKGTTFHIIVPETEPSGSGVEADQRADAQAE